MLRETIARRFRWMTSPLKKGKAGMAEAKADAEGDRSKGFWHTLPGILTGAAGMIAAIASLAAAVYQISKPTDPVPKPAIQGSGVSADFETIPTQDGFTSVRQAPSTKSAENRRLPAGTRVTCQAVVKGEPLWGSSDWRHCPSVDGYIHSKLLIPK